MIRFVLASASPARLATLRAAGVDPDVVVSGIDESVVTTAETSTLVGALAEAKATVVAAQTAGDAVVLGCDSLLELDGHAHGKPGTSARAVAQWHQMVGRSAVLHTGHTLLRLADGVICARASATAATVVHFAAVSDDELARYVDSGEPLDVAGAFTVDRLGGWFVDAISGDHHNVVGVSLPVVRRLLHEVGLSVVDIWRTG